MTHVYSETEVVARVEGLTVARLRLLADLERDFNLDAGNHLGLGIDVRHGTTPLRGS